MDLQLQRRFEEACYLVKRCRKAKYRRRSRKLPAHALVPPPPVPAATTVLTRPNLPSRIKALQAVQRNIDELRSLVNTLLVLEESDEHPRPGA